MPRYGEDDTIAAIATPPGAGGIGIIRVSGREARRIAAEIFRPAKPGQLESHRLTYGHIVDPADGRVIDEVMLCYMRAPNSYTREDVVEIQAHAGSVVLRTILSLVTGLGARLAEPGEFTKRAFLNGRIDLTRAEAILDLLNARTRNGLDIAVSNLQGGVSRRLYAVRDALISIRAAIEVAIDFPEDEEEIIGRDHAASLGEEVVKPLERLVAAARRGSIVRDGVELVICGRPNVGKSSLLNALVGRERAIVTSVAGTTRDLIEESFDLNGVPVRITDTAGIREHRDPVEEIGIRMARERLRQADQVVLVVDGSQEPDRADLDFIAENGLDDPLIAVNKLDRMDERKQERFRGFFAPRIPVFISAREGTRLEELTDALYRRITGGRELWDPGCDCVPNLRQLAALERGLDAARRVDAGFAQGAPADLVAVDLQEALDAIGEITGETTAEDILDRIFSEFCIGK